jgi:branched-chain amino acid transport system ATP-binding protein
MTGLETRNLTRRFGGLTAVDHVDFRLQPGEIVGIIGPNGAGKTTLINLLAGMYQPSEGEILFNGEEISTVPAHRRAALGIGRTFQLIHPLEDLSLVENVMTGFLFAQKHTLRRGREEARALCRSLGLTGLDRSTGELNILETKKMEIAKALAGGPSVVFLDEVMAGLNSDETMDIIHTVREIATEQNLGIGVVEHVMGVIRELTERVVVLDAGAVIAAGPYSEVSKDERVISAYLGGGA